MQEQEQNQTEPISDVPVSDGPAVSADGEEVVTQTGNAKKKFSLTVCMLLVVGVILLIVAAIYLYIYFSSEGEEPLNLFDREGLLAVCDAEGKWGYVNKQGNVIIDCRFDKAYPFTYFGLAAVCEDGEWGYIRKNGEYAFTERFGTACPFDEKGIARIEDRDGEWGIIDKDGNYVLKPTYYKIGTFNQFGLATVLDADLYGLIDRSGQLVVKCQYDSISSFSEDGYAIAKRYSDKEGGYRHGLLSKEGKVIVEPKYDLIDGASSDEPLFVCDRVRFRDKDGYGYLNSKGEEVLRAIYDSAYPFSENGLAAVQRNGIWGYIDRNGEYAFKLSEDCVPGKDGFAANGLAAVKENGEWGYINNRGEYVIRPYYLSAKGFEKNGLAVVQNKKDKYGIIDKADKEVVPFEYDRIEVVHRGGELYYYLEKDSVEYFADRQGKILFDGFDVDRIIAVDSAMTKFSVKVGSTYGVVDRKGKTISEFTDEYSIVFFFDDGFWIVGDDSSGFMGIMNQKGETVIPADRFTDACPYYYFNDLNNYQ